MISLHINAYCARCRQFACACEQTRKKPATAINGNDDILHHIFAYGGVQSHFQIKKTSNDATKNNYVI